MTNTKDIDIHSAMINAYKFLIEGESYSEAMRRNNTEEIFYPFPLDDITIGDLRLVMEYFASEDVEMYEKSQRIKNLLNNWSNKSQIWTQSN